MSDRGKSWDSMCVLSERILQATSATEELEQWCSEHAIGDGRTVVLCARYAMPEALDDESLETLYPHNVRGRTKFGRVRLATAGIVIVESLNWYFPDRLTAEMREMFETTNIPFERMIKSLRPKRRTFLVRRCTPEQLVDANGTIDPTAIAFEHRAVVYGGDDVPLAVVHERFRSVLVRNVTELGKVVEFAAPYVAQIQERHESFRIPKTRAPAA